MIEQLKQMAEQLKGMATLIERIDTQSQILGLTDSDDYHLKALGASINDLAVYSTRTLKARVIAETKPPTCPNCHGETELGPDTKHFTCFHCGATGPIR